MSDEVIPGPENTTASGRGRWAKGISGNPGGRPRAERQVRELAQTYGPRAIRRLAQLMRSSNERVAVAAASALLDRGYGKPPLAVTGADGAPLFPPAFLTGAPISDAATAAEVYAFLIGNPTADMTGITFAAPEADAAVAPASDNPSVAEYPPPASDFVGTNVPGGEQPATQEARSEEETGTNVPAQSAPDAEPIPMEEEDWGARRARQWARSAE
jgi:hypothetical protein